MFKRDCLQNLCPLKILLIMPHSSAKANSPVLSYYVCAVLNPHLHFEIQYLNQITLSGPDQILNYYSTLLSR